MPLDKFFDTVRDGDERGWAEEIGNLLFTHGQKMRTLRDDINLNGIQEPIHIGGDGRCWNGHKRVAVAMLLGLNTIPVQDDRNSVTAKTHAHIALVVDRSGSMMTTRDDAEGGIRNFIAEQSALTDVDVTISLFQFDEKFEHVYGSISVADAPPYELVPRGMTALYDAIGKSITETDLEIRTADFAPDKIVLVVVTDGEENSSVEHTFNSISKLVKEQKEAGWEIIFLASDIKAVEFGRDAGLNTTSYAPTSQGTQTAYRKMSEYTTSYLSGKSESIDMPDDVKE